MESTGIISHKQAAAVNLSEKTSFWITLYRSVVIEKKIIYVITMLLLLFGCGSNKNDVSTISTSSELLCVYANMTIDEFKTKYNTSVTNDACKIKDWSEPMPGMVRFNFSDQFELSLGISPNEKNEVYIPQVFSKSLDLSNMTLLEEVMLGILKVGDSTIDENQVAQVVEKIKLSEIEIKTLEVLKFESKKTSVNDIGIEATYSYDNGLGIMFYDKRSIG